MAEEKKQKISKKDPQAKKIADLKIELLKQPQKRKGIKKEIARLLTKKTSQNVSEAKSGGNK